MNVENIIVKGKTRNWFRDTCIRYRKRLIGLGLGAAILYGGFVGYENHQKKIWEDQFLAKESSIELLTEEKLYYSALENVLKLRKILRNRPKDEMYYELSERLEKMHGELCVLIYEEIKKGNTDLNDYDLNVHAQAFLSDQISYDGTDIKKQIVSLERGLEISEDYMRMKEHWRTSDHRLSRETLDQYIKDDGYADFMGADFDKVASIFYEICERAFDGEKIKTYVGPSRRISDDLYAQGRPEWAHDEHHFRKARERFWKIFNYIIGLRVRSDCRIRIPIEEFAGLKALTEAEQEQYKADLMKIILEELNSEVRKLKKQSNKQ